jgi:hypothetical protein
MLMVKFIEPETCIFHKSQEPSNTSSYIEQGYHYLIAIEPLQIVFTISTTEPKGCIIEDAEGDYFYLLLTFLLLDVLSVM